MYRNVNVLLNIIALHAPICFSFLYFFDRIWTDSKINRSKLNFYIHKFSCIIIIIKVYLFISETLLQLLVACDKLSGRGVLESLSKKKKKTLHSKLATVILPSALCSICSVLMHFRAASRRAKVTPAWPSAPTPAASASSITEMGIQLFPALWHRYVLLETFSLSLSGLFFPPSPP